MRSTFRRLLQIMQSLWHHILSGLVRMPFSSNRAQRMY